MKWDNDKLPQFLNDCHLNKFDDFLNDLSCILQNDVDMCIEMFCDFYLKSSSMMFRSFPTFKQIKNFDKTSFFDSECYQHKLVLRKHLRKYINTWKNYGATTTATI